ncbi:hypothetical protein HBB16_11590 [Pseudonocardia sp. MCCB 268]|nr:hypothetical protein [Pseudonocardia cytotoxica]
MVVEVRVVALDGRQRAGPTRRDGRGAPCRQVGESNVLVISPRGDGRGSIVFGRPARRKPCWSTPAMIGVRVSTCRRTATC